jgi:predicted nucleic acid-binding protein
LDDFLISARIAADFDLGQFVWRDAGRRFAAYARRRRHSAAETPKRLLVDFLVGAHATLKADRLLTLDSHRYRKDFPKLKLL